MRCKSSENHPSLGGSPGSPGVTTAEAARRKTLRRDREHISWDREGLPGSFHSVRMAWLPGRLDNISRWRDLSTQNPDAQILFYLTISALQLSPCGGFYLVTWRSDPGQLFMVLFGSKAHVSPCRWKKGANVCRQVVGISGNDEGFLLLNDKTT